MAGERLGIHSFTILNSLMSTNIYCRLFVLFIDCQVPKSTFFLTEILFLSLLHYWRCKILVFCGCFISSNVLFVFSVMLASIVIIVYRFICLVIKFTRLTYLVFMHSACVYLYHFCILRVFMCLISAFLSLCQFSINLIKIDHQRGLLSVSFKYQFNLSISLIENELPPSN